MIYNKQNFLVSLWFKKSEIQIYQKYHSPLSTFVCNIAPRTENLNCEGFKQSAFVVHVANDYIASYDNYFKNMVKANS